MSVSADRIASFGPHPYIHEVPGFMPEPKTEHGIDIASLHGYKIPMVLLGRWVLSQEPGRTVVAQIAESIDLIVDQVIGMPTSGWSGAEVAMIKVIEQGSARESVHYQKDQITSIQPGSGGILSANRHSLQEVFAGLGINLEPRSSHDPRYRDLLMRQPHPVRRFIRGGYVTTDYDLVNRKERLRKGLTDGEPREVQRIIPLHIHNFDSPVPPTAA